MLELIIIGVLVVLLIVVYLSSYERGVAYNKLLQQKNVLQNKVRELEAENDSLKRHSKKKSK